jgi:membrane fusion protein, multidrug efflux system
MPTTTEKESPEVSTASSRPGPRPQRSTRPKSRWWVWLLVLGVLAGGAYWLAHRMKTAETRTAQKAPAAPPAVPVVAEQARSGDLPMYLDALGSVTAFNTVTVKSRVDGQLSKVAFQEGQFVHQGDLIALIDPRPFQVQVAQAEGQLARDLALKNNAVVDLERYKYLLAQGLIPKQQYDTQAAAIGQYDGTIKADQALIDSATLQLSYTRITAPISGRMGLRLVDEGNMVHAGDTNGLAVITQIQPIAVLFTIPEDNLRSVLKRLRAGERLPVEAYDRSGQNKIADGRLLTVDNQIDQTTGTSKLKAVFENQGSLLFPNQFVNVRLLVETKKNQVIVPAVTIQRGPKGTFVYVVKADQTVEPRPVKVGATEGNDSLIEDGLQAGETVVTDGVDKLRAGIKVQVAAPRQPK